MVTESTALALSLSAMLAVALAPVMFTAGLLELEIWAARVSVASNRASSVTATAREPEAAPLAMLIWAPAGMAV